MFQTSYSLINEAHCFYCLSCCLAWVRLISFYILNSTVGPLWIMLRKMLVEAVCFLSVLGVITLAAGITLQVKRFAFLAKFFLLKTILTPYSSFSFSSFIFVFGVITKVVSRFLHYIVTRYIFFSVFRRLVLDVFAYYFIQRCSVFIFFWFLV